MEGLMEHKWGVAVATVTLAIVIHVMVGFLKSHVWRQHSIRKAMQAQGVAGPKPELMNGNLLEIETLRAAAWRSPIAKSGKVNHDYVYHVFPHYKVWGEKYGSKFVMWWGNEPALLETDIDLVMEVFGSKHDGDYGKHSNLHAILSSAIGEGLATANGTIWHKRRRLIQPTFHTGKMKELMKPMISASTILVKSWEKALQVGGEWTHDVAPDMIAVAADVISRVAFKTSYKDSNGAFEKQIQLLKMAFDFAAWEVIPGYNYIPTPGNVKRWKLEFQVASTLKSLVQAGMDVAKENSNEMPRDLLEMLLAAYHAPESMVKGLTFTKLELMNEMRTFFVAGFDTISAALIWTMMLLANNPTWQERIHEEIKEFCEDGNFNTFNVTKLKVLGMVLNESMRLYPPIPELVRTTVKDVQLGKIHVPKGLSIFICLPLMHRKLEVWGMDANEFKPERFKDGVASACSTPVGWMPFSYGPRTCVASSFAMLELKVVLAMIIHKFKFTLAPNYLHNPIIVGVALKPKHGVPLIISKR